MLERIEHLLYGLKDVSDNIAHDLKTPLTRLRNRVEGALAGPADTGQVPLGAGGDDRGIRPAHPDLQRAPDDRAHRGGLARRRHDRTRFARDRAGRGRSLRAGGRGERRRAHGGDAASRSPSRAAANCSARRSPTSSTTPSSTARAAARRERRGSSFPPPATATASCSGWPTTGRASPRGDRERVLQRFVRLEESRSQPGSGLGLSLVAAVARLHHGTLELGDGKPGLVVTIRLPTEMTADDHRKREAGGIPKGKPKASGRTLAERIAPRLRPAMPPRGRRRASPN